MTHESGTLPSEGVKTMFDRIAPVYDAMNRVMTMGLDQRWRRLTAELAVREGDRVLDACCGTGDLALADLKAGAASVVGDEVDQERAQPLAARLDRLGADARDEPRVRRDGLAEQILDVVEVRPGGVEHGLGGHAASPTCSATIPPASRR